jgi:hypothetical protein
MTTHTSDELIKHHPCGRIPSIDSVCACDGLDNICLSTIRAGMSLPPQLSNLQGLKKIVSRTMIQG